MWILTTRAARKPVFLFLGIAVLLNAGCARQRPVLYPNTHYKSVGAAAAKEDVDWCFAYAERHGAGPQPAQRAAGGAAKGAIVGGAAGAAVGAVTGNAGTGAAAGAAGGAAAGLSRAMLDSGKPDSVERGFVEQCLKDLGYQTTGWR
jgi:outer membrane lipoprotein SlyB